MPRLYKTTGSITQMKENPSLQEMQEAVGGDIEIIHLPQSKGAFVVNSNGKHIGLAKNRNATVVVKRMYDDKWDDTIVGNAIMLNAHELRQME